MTIDFKTPMTFYELLAIILAAIAIVIPIVQVIWKKWIQKPQLNYITNGKARLLFNQSGSYFQVDGVYEAINKPVSVKKVSIQVNRKKNSRHLDLPFIKILQEMHCKQRKQHIHSELTQIVLCVLS